MSAEQGWIGEPQPPRTWNKSRASAAHDWVEAEQQRRRQEAGDNRPVTVDW